MSDLKYGIIYWAKIDRLIASRHMNIRYFNNKLGKNLETCVQRCLWGEGRGRVCVNWKTSQKFKSIPTFVHDCSLSSSSLLCTVLVSRISESEPGQYAVYNGHAMTAAENRTCMVTLLLSDFTSRTS